MTFLIISFIAGLLTVLAPCVLPLLPVVVGSAASGRSRNTPYIVVGSLALSIIAFTYILKVSTAFIMIPPQTWMYLSGGILTIFGLTLLFPALWGNIPGIAKLSSNSNKVLGAGYQKKSFWGDVIIGASLGPIFSTCSPTYFVILASVLPASFLLGTIYLLAYVLGLSIVLLLIAMLGERFASKLGVLSDPHSSFKKVLGALFIILGLLIVFGIEKKIETAILDSGFFDITKIEQRLLQQNDPNVSESQGTNGNSYQTQPYVEIVNPSGFVNTDGAPIALSDYVGKKVILVDFMTYSCINCQRTFPYMAAWYEKYKDEGLIIVGIHTPEFAFEKNIDNVRAAMEKFGITYPVVLDNDYATWGAYGNQYWPRKYLIDINGTIVYDHIGEGDYAETEMKIQELLKERASVLGMDSMSDRSLAATNITEVKTQSNSPETYFGSLRNEYLGNGKAGLSGEQQFTQPQTPGLNTLYLGGTWNIQREYASGGAGSSVLYKYAAKDVYIVAESDSGAEIEVWQDGKRVDAAGGDDVVSGSVTVKGSQLYKLIHNARAEGHTLELRVKSGTVRLYAFTFG
ncbi:redoxin domain-containing protein [Candidatus Parcubacteria bacterium]|uniref:Cytochrome C biogenesis protein n=1 Tax=Candidatus Kaiserbacteria bacterium CG10_big_fil_rev_8_21_14_0_10_47_16 TaxID=1974608 RepID=A0A2H0UD92_9BACT|nr:redoxin domain-containing protein [Candidatus Parcubacteria bacterium]PIR84357.1 MAG: cytochrome C biogenesis protein [Candidatus Kaiserbacteria bacterium CG10_big_fil_rev_8_21_14_0_10_47_16]